MWGGMWTHPSEKERQRASAVFREACLIIPSLSLELAKALVTPGLTLTDAYGSGVS